MNIFCWSSVCVYELFPLCHLLQTRKNAQLKSIIYTEVLHMSVPPFLQWLISWPLSNLNTLIYHEGKSSTDELRESGVSTVLSRFSCTDLMVRPPLFFNIFSYFPFLPQNHDLSSTDNYSGHCHHLMEWFIPISNEKS